MPATGSWAGTGPSSLYAQCLLRERRPGPALAQGRQRPVQRPQAAHHQAVQIEMLYYPQDVTEVMGPTATIPYSHYWTFNHEENHDNFAGADHLDFEYQISGMEGVPVSGPDSEYDWEDVVHRRTAHDVRMREAVSNTGWPLVKPLEAAPLRAGSVLLYSHNTFHRGNHRRDDWRLWDDHPRFMWRFWIYRTTEPDGRDGGEPDEIDWRVLGVDPLTGVDLRNADDDATVVWRYHNHWMRTGRTPPRSEARALSAKRRETEARDLYEQLLATGDEAEPRRIGAAYRLASIGDDALVVKHLGAALYSHRESVRRAATYGLIAVGESGHEYLPRSHEASPVKWVRKAGVYGLGDCAPLTGEVLECCTASLLHQRRFRLRPRGRRGNAGLPGSPRRGDGRWTVPGAPRSRSAHPQPRTRGEPAEHGPGPEAEHQVRAAHRRVRRLRGQRRRHGSGSIRAGALRGAGERPLVHGHPLFPRGQSWRAMRWIPPSMP